MVNISFIYFWISHKDQADWDWTEENSFFIEMSDRTEEISEGWGERRAERKGEQRGYLWV